MKPKKMKHLIGSTIKKIYQPFALATAKYRPLPDFVIIGASRSGTTHLFHTLEQHPQIVRSRKKELHFFDKNENYVRGINYYKSSFPLSFNLPDDALVVEATPAYIYSAQASVRLKKHLPNLKLILLLRNPIQRAISSYFNGKRKGYEPRTIDEVFINNPTLIHEDYIQKGIYIDQIQRYEKYLSEGNLLILQSEELFNNKSKVLKDVEKYLNVDAKLEFAKNVTKHEVKRNEKVSKEIYAVLDQIFDPYNKRLYAYLEKDFDWVKPDNL